MKQMAIRMKPSEAHSLMSGNFPPKNCQKINVAAVPAIREVSRLTSPANVAVRPLKIKMNTEKKAAIPKKLPQNPALINLGWGCKKAPRNACTCGISHPNQAMELKTINATMRSVVVEAYC